MVNASGAVVARYSYNAWGELLSVTNASGQEITNEYHIANLNHLRYRGYYYDSETGFYYLQSRYYDPANHRFINADSYASTGQGILGQNMFAYCLNNPVNGFDPSGTRFQDPNCRTCGGLDEYTDTGTGSALLNGQSVCKYSDYRFYDATVAAAGCGVIASYNAMLLSGKHTTFEATLSYYEQQTWLTRKLGVMPWEIADYLDHMGVSYTGYGSLPSLQEACAPGDVVIATFWNERGGSVSFNFSAPISYPNVFKGAHTVAFQCTSSGVTVYNPSNYATNAKNYGSFKEYMDDGLFIYAFKIN